MEGSVIGVPPACQRPARVLVVDHESAAHQLLSLILGPPALQCATASNGEEALAAL
jgi:CheY-like chemotaxis protein